MRKKLHPKQIEMLRAILADTSMCEHITTIKRWDMYSISIFIAFILREGVYTNDHRHQLYLNQIRELYIEYRKMYQPLIDQTWYK